MRGMEPSGGSDARLTVEEVLALPEDGWRHEVLDGEHVVSQPVVFHQRLVMRLTRALLIHLEQRPEGELLPSGTGVVFSLYDLVGPDLVFVRHDRRHIVQEKYVSGAPDLVVEVLSPATRQIDERLKRKLYERYGVPEYWLVDPEAGVVQVYRLRGRRFTTMVLTAEGHDVLTSPAFPELAIPVADLFRR